jgi:hypothetical protein
MKEVYKKHLQIIGYLLGSGLCAFLLLYLTKLPKEYSVLLAPAINYIAYAIQLELKNEGIVRHGN